MQYQMSLCPVPCYPASDQYTKVVIARIGSLYGDITGQHIRKGNELTLYHVDPTSIDQNTIAYHSVRQASTRGNGFWGTTKTEWAIVNTKVDAATIDAYYTIDVAVTTPLGNKVVGRF